MDASCYDSRFDIHLNSCLQIEMPGTSLPSGRRGSSDFRLQSPLKKNIGLLAKKRISMKEFHLIFSSESLIGFFYFMAKNIINDFCSLLFFVISQKLPVKFPPRLTFVQC